MLDVESQTQRPIHFIRRTNGLSALDMVVRPVRASSFTSMPYADAWIVDEGDGVLTLQIDDRCLAVIQGLDLDQHSLNLLLDRLRHRPPLPRR